MLKSDYLPGDRLTALDANFLNERLLGELPELHEYGTTEQIFDIPIKNRPGGPAIEPYHVVQVHDEYEDGFIVKVHDSACEFFIVVGPGGLPADGYGMGSLAYDPVWVKVKNTGASLSNRGEINVNATYGQNLLAPPTTETECTYDAYNNRTFSGLGFYSLGVLNFKSFSESDETVLAVQRNYYNNCVGTYQVGDGVLDFNSNLTVYGSLRYPGKYRLNVDAILQYTLNLAGLIGKIRMIVKKNGDTIATSEYSDVRGVRYNTHPFGVGVVIPFPTALTIATFIDLLPGEDILSLEFEGMTPMPTMKVTANLKRIGAYGYGHGSEFNI